jgi:hypothetical protein
VRVRVRVRAPTRERARKNPPRSGRELVRAPGRAQQRRALARAQQRRALARAHAKALARAEPAKAERAKAEPAKAEPAKAERARARIALNPPRALTVRSNNSAAELNGPAAREFDVGPICEATLAVPL